MGTSSAWSFASWVLRPPWQPPYLDGQVPEFVPWPPPICSTAPQFHLAPPALCWSCRPLGSRFSGGTSGYLGVEDPEASPWLLKHVFAVPRLHSNHLCHPVRLPNCWRTAKVTGCSGPNVFFLASKALRCNSTASLRLPMDGTAIAKFVIVHKVSPWLGAKHLSWEAKTWRYNSTASAWWFPMLWIVRAKSLIHDIASWCSGPKVFALDVTSSPHSCTISPAAFFCLLIMSCRAVLT